MWERVVRVALKAKNKLAGILMRPTKKKGMNIFPKQMHGIW